MTVGTNSSAHLYDTTLNTNGALYSAASGVVTSTSAGGAGTVFAGSAGAPSFTATPSVTSITLSSGTALSAYLENNFTPAINFGGGATGITYSVQNGRYTNIGRAVVFEILLILTSKGSSTGNATITNLPFFVGNGNLPFFGYFAAFTSFPASTTIPMAVSGGGSKTLTLYGYNGSTGGVTNFTNTNFSGTDQIYINGSYQMP
ncbi:MAG: hypothetical protein JSR39_10940 [Verrucomicrobia bacterium]|nr:hypothetical protein [Verrucomicrobiota bacterium]